MRSVAIAAMLAMSAPGLHAACNDAPAEKVDWSGCAKQRLMLNKQAL
jgi:hypothetical protein